jgi:hypothetical protein
MSSAAVTIRLIDFERTQIRDVDEDDESWGRRCVDEMQRVSKMFADTCLGWR